MKLGSRIIGRLLHVHAWQLKRAFRGMLAGTVSVGTSVGGLTVWPGLHSSHHVVWVLRVSFSREKVRGKLYLIIFLRHRSHTAVLYSIH